MNNLVDELDEIRSRLVDIGYEARPTINLQRLFSEIASFVANHVEDDAETLARAADKICELEEQKEGLESQIAELKDRVEELEARVSA